MRCLFLNDLEQKILENSKTYAEAKGFALNSDEKILNAVIAGLAKNARQHGKPYCPCRALTGSEEEDAKNVCPCAFHLEEIEKDGHCKCRLFFK